jgi:hypothetical protein
MLPVFRWIYEESNGGGHECKDDRMDNEHGECASVENASL